MELERRRRTLGPVTLAIFDECVEAWHYTVEYVDIQDRRVSRLLIIDRQNRVLLLQYEDEHGRWWATPGGAREFESFENAALREAREELGLSGFPIQPLWQGIPEEFAFVKRSNSFSSAQMVATSS